MFRPNKIRDIKTMEYPFEEINNIADCELLKREAQRDKAIAENKKSNLVFQADQNAGTIQNRSVDLQDAETDMAKVVNQQAGENPTSTDWKKLESKRRDLEARIYKLELNQSLSVGVNRLDRIYEINKLDAEINEANKLISGADARIAQL